MAGEFRLIFVAEPFLQMQISWSPNLQVTGEGRVRAAGPGPRTPWTLPPAAKAVAVGLEGSARTGEHTGPGWERMEAEFMWGLGWTEVKRVCPFVALCSSLIPLPSEVK